MVKISLENQRIINQLKIILRKSLKKKQNPIQNKEITSKENTSINDSNKILQNTKKEKERTNKNIIQPKNQTEKSKEKDEANKNIKIESKIGKLIDGKHPVYGSKKIGEIKGMKNTLELYDYPLNIEYSSNEESISVIFIGQSGTGKSTFINAYVNHLLGITQYDDIRYKLILGDQSKEKYQTINQTDFITIYNVRSPRYKNKLFKLIDTPGAGDTRNDNEKNISKIEQKQKERELLSMYNDLFTKEIGQLNSITLVIKASENRDNEFQKKIIKSIANLFAGDINKNCLAILTHTDNFVIMPDAVPLLEKIDIFKKKTANNEEWYFPVSSTSYFTPFQKDKPSVGSLSFSNTEEYFEKYTQKLLTLKLYYTKQTQKNLQLKEQQEKIIKVLKDDVIDNIFSQITKLEDNKVNLNKKIKECDEKQKEIEEIKKTNQYEDNLRKEIEKNYNVYIAYKLDIENEINKNKEKITQLSDKKKSIDEELKSIENKIIKPEEEKYIEYKKKDLQNKIEDFEKEISQLKTEIDVIIKRKEELNIKINEAKKNLDEKETIIKSKNKEATQMTKVLEEVFKKEQEKLEDEKKRLETELKKYKDNAIRHFLTIKIINEEIEKLTLNKSTVNSVYELIKQLSLNDKFIDNKRYFNGIIDEYQNIVKEIDQSNNKNGIYEKYGLDLDSIRKIENIQ